MRLAWVGALNLDRSDLFRAAALSALDRARSARIPLVLDLSQLGVIDRQGLVLLVAFGRTAQATGVPLRIDRPPVRLRVDMKAMNAIELFDWPMHDE